ncbi:hypothetical protein AGLY_011961 [Aphis glycines]|uniref:HAT C-terminal dimerisation domain-containing protein n=1 Tax=Aphis glycines TaxID=307491 RepID=A0A6G0TBB2_APHGL|nr:hypothetical protein AGLY_011961 [Aphis glycines]
MPKRKCVFTDKLKEEYKFLKQCQNTNDCVRCSTCNSEFSVEHRGRYDIENHIQSDRHKRLVKRCPQQCAAKEATFAYHTATHGLSFRTSDCTAKLIKKFFEPKYSGARTKTEAIIVNIIPPYIFNELLKDLKDVNFVTLTIDSSNRKEIKLTPVCVRYFNKNEGIKVKLLYFDQLPGETSDILVEHHLKCIKKYSIDSKVVCLCADNTNTNFGDVKRKGQGNVFRKLQKSLSRPILGIGCAAHILHNTVKTACDALSIDVEYTVRVTALKEFCEFANIEYKRVLSHGNTRFLSLLPAIERILLLFDALKSYFMAIENCPAVLLAFFKDPVSELFLKFVHGTVQMFQISILKLDSDYITASEATQVYEELVIKLEEQKENNFIPFAANQLLVKLKDDNTIDVDKENHFRKNMEGFYQAGINYLKLWENSFDKANKFKWLTLQNDPTWEEIEASAIIVVSIVPNSINVDQLFDERSFLVQVPRHLKPKWASQQNELTPKMHEKWKEIFDAFFRSNVSFLNIFKIIEFAMCLPGTSAPAEQLLNIKANSDLSCSQFHDKIKIDKCFLKKINASEKYEKKKDDEECCEPGPSTN